MNTPDDVPDSGDHTELSDDELLAQFTAFRARLDASLGDHDAMFELSTEMWDFLQKNRARITELEITTDDYLAELGEIISQFKTAREVAAKAEEEYFQATADVAEHEEDMMEAFFKMMHHLHLSWDELDYAEREKFSDMIESYMENREEYLSRLPIEKRRMLEAAYPKWW